jgi:hypothetical protein
MTASKKRLYTVTVDFDYAVLAEDEDEACQYADEALRDQCAAHFSQATLTVTRLSTGQFVERLPDAEEDSLVYGDSEGDVTLAEAIASERARLETAVLAAKQGDLFKEKP